MKNFFKYLFFIFLFLLFAGPVIIYLWQANKASWQEIHEFTSIAKVLKNTFISSFFGALFSLVIGVFFASRFTKYKTKALRLQRLSIILPYLVPNFVLAICYVLSWNSQSGVLNSILPLGFPLYSHIGLSFIFAVVHAPIVLLIAEDKWNKLDPSLLEAAQISGLSSFKSFLKIELPMLMPSLMSCFALCFSLNVSAFAIPAWLGAPERIYPLSYKIYQMMQLGGEDSIRLSAVYSQLLVLMVLPAIFLVFYFQRNTKKYANLGGKSNRKNIKSAKPAYNFVYYPFYFLYVLYSWIGPLLVLLLSSIVKPGCLQQNGFACLQELSAHNFRYVLFELEDTMIAFKTSLLYGSLSVFIILALSLLVLLIFNNNRRMSQASEWIFSILAAAPGAVIAIGLIVSFSGAFVFNLYNTVWIVVLAYVVKHFNLCFQSVKTGFQNISQQLSEAAKISGASKWQTWRYIILPILKPEFISAGFLCLIPIVGELSMSVFLSSPSFKSIGSVLFDLQDYADQSAAAALAILLVISILILNQLARWFSNSKVGY